MIWRALRNRAGLSIAILLLIGAVTAQAIAERDSSRDEAALSSHDADPKGALALALWLEDLGYHVIRLEGASSPSMSSVDVLFLLRPVRPLDRAEVEAILAWVREGGVLIYLPNWLPFPRQAPAATTDVLADEIGLGIEIGPPVEYAGAALPLFATGSRFWVSSVASLELRDDAWARLIEGNGRIFAATRQVGNGRVHVASAEAFFSNHGIRQNDNAALVLYVLAQQPARRAIAFEESHHSFFQAPDLAAVARSSPWGWALAYAVLVTFGFVVWGGRRFGPALIADRPLGRSSGEYVIAFAGLLQRARATSWVQQHYAGLLRRRLARMLGVPSTVSVAELSGRLAEQRSGVDAMAVAEHLAALEGRTLAERDLLARVRALDAAVFDEVRTTTETQSHGDEII